MTEKVIRPLMRTHNRCQCGTQIKGVRVCKKCGTPSKFTDICSCGNRKWKDTEKCSTCQHKDLMRNKGNPDNRCSKCGARVNVNCAKCSICGGERNKPRRCLICGESKSLLAVSCNKCRTTIGTPNIKSTEIVKSKSNIAFVKRTNNRTRYVKERFRAKPKNPYYPCPGYTYDGIHHVCPTEEHPRSVWRDGRYVEAQCAACWYSEDGLEAPKTYCRWENVPSRIEK